MLLDETFYGSVLLRRTLKDSANLLFFRVCYLPYIMKMDIGGIFPFSSDEEDNAQLKLLDKIIEKDRN
jgi:hypothetical protein